MPKCKHLVALTLLSSLPVLAIADDISDKLSQITQALNSLKNNTTSNQTKEIKLNQSSLQVIRPKKKLLRKAPIEEYIAYEDIGSLIKPPDLLTNPIVTLFSLSPSIYDYLISSSITTNFHLDAPNYSQGKMLTIVGYAPSDSKVWCMINNQKVFLSPTQLPNQPQSVIFAGFFKSKADNEFNVYQYTPCYIKSAHRAYKNLVLLRN